MSIVELPQAPGALSARTMGILSMAMAIFCFPIGLVLGILALVMHAKAKAAFAAQPGSFRPVTRTGLVTGLLGIILTLFMTGILYIGIRILLDARPRRQDREAVANLHTAMGELASAYQQERAETTLPKDLAAGLEARAQELNRTEGNPWQADRPAFTFQILEAPTPEALEAAASTRATQRGQVVLLVSPPDPSRSKPCLLAGAVRIHPLWEDPTVRSESRVLN